MVLFGGVILLTILGDDPIGFGGDADVPLPPPEIALHFFLPSVIFLLVKWGKPQGSCVSIGVVAEFPS